LATDDEHTIINYYLRQLLFLKILKFPSVTNNPDCNLSKWWNNCSVLKIKIFGLVAIKFANITVYGRTEHNTLYQMKSISFVSTCTAKIYDWNLNFEFTG